MEKNVDLKDLLATILSKWLVLVICIVIGALIGAGLTWLRASGPEEAEVSAQDALSSARDSLTAEQVQNVDYLYTQYAAYRNYRFLLQDYVADSLYIDDSVQTVLNALYYVESDIADIDACYSILALSTQEWDELSRILGASAMQRVTIGGTDPMTLGANTAQHVTLSGADPKYVQDVQVRIEENKDVCKEVIRVTIAAADRQQAGQALSIIDDAFARETDQLRSLDAELVFEELGTQYSEDGVGYETERLNDVIAALDNATTRLLNLETNYVEEMTQSERVYFEALEHADENRSSAPASVSLKRPLILGAVIGLLAGVVLLVLWYIFNSRVKTMADVTAHTKASTPYVIYRKKPGIHGSGPLVRKMKGAALSEQAVRQEVVDSHLAISLSKQESASVYVACDDPEVQQNEIVRNLQSLLLKKAPEVSFAAGNPMTDTKALSQFSEADSVILMIRLKKTRYPMLDQWMELSRQYERPVAGLIVTEDC